MIQRIQSVYLLLGALALGGLAFFDAIWGSVAAARYAWFEPTMIALTALTALTGFGAIFLYNDRPRQRTVIIGVQGLTVLLTGVLFVTFFLTGELRFFVDGAWQPARTAALALPVVAYVLFLLARRGVEHDIELVKSMDRIR
jgi:hypothetical protein